MFFLVVMIPFLVFAAGMWLALRKRSSQRVTDPSCGHCRYIVRGLEGDICPECGSDLRVVGILQPGAIKPLQRWQRALLWFFIAPAPTFILWAILTPLIGPQWQLTTQRRVIFSQTSYCNVIITANAEDKKLVFGYPRSSTATSPWAPVPMRDVLFLSAGSPTQSLNVDLTTNTARTFAKTGLRQTPFDAKSIELWLNDRGFTDPRVADRAADIYAAVTEIGTPAGVRFTRFAPEAGYTFSGIAHPASVFNRPQPNELTMLFPFVLFIVVYLIGLPFALRSGRAPIRSISVSPVSAHSDTAETAALR